MRRYCFAQLRISPIGLAKPFLILAFVSTFGIVASTVHAAANPLSIPIQLTHSLNYATAAAPDGKRLVTISVIANRGQIFVMNVDGSNPVQITHDLVDYDDPQWSPDGKKIIATAVTKDQERICIMNPDGSGMQTLTPPDIRAIHGSWSSDSKLVIFCADDDVQPPKKNDTKIYTIDVETKALKTVISGGVNTYPSFSPDTKKIAFRKIFGDMNSEVFVANNDGTNSRVEELYRTFQKFPNISAKCANESIGQSFDAEYEALPKEIYEETYYQCRLNDVAVSSFIEHRARLAILKNAIDYILYRNAGDESKTLAIESIKVLGKNLQWSHMNFLPKAFRDGLDEIAKEPYFHRYPVFWQWFLWFFGGFILTDLRDKEYELFARYTGVPPNEIPNALAAYEKLFPMPSGWFMDLGARSKTEQIKMMSVPFMGVGANVRRLAYAESNDFEKIPTGGQFTIKDLKTWNNTTVELLRS